MINRLALHELKKDIKIMLPVTLQLSCALILIIACVSSVTSRFKYYKPFEALIERNGCVAVIQTVSNYNSNDLKNKLHNCENVYMEYYFAAGSGITAPTVYDDYIMESYPLEMLSGDWVISNPNKNYPQIVVSENTGYNVGEIISTDMGYTFEVAGIFKDSQKMFSFNNMVADQCDYRLFYSEDDKNSERIIISRSEAEKCKGICYPDGLAFIVYNSNISTNEEMDNGVILSENGMIGSFSNTDLKNNSKKYIYDQLYTLLPILICVILLLFVSLVSANSITTVKRIKNYAIYRMCGLSCNKCTLISVLKSIYISVLSLIICYVLFIIKEKYSLFNTFIMDVGLIQILCCIAFLIVNIIVSYVVCKLIIQRNELNRIIKEN